MVGPWSGSDVCAKYNLPDSEWHAMGANLRALFRMAYASDVAHVEEVPRGSNEGPEIDRVLSIAGVGPGNPWCASVGTAYLVDSGVPRAGLPVLAASVHAWGEWAHAQGRIIAAPVRGCACLIYETANSGHWTMCASVVGLDMVQTIAGNTVPQGNPGNIREGYGVFRRQYKPSQFALFVRLDGLA